MAELDGRRLLLWGALLLLIGLAVVGVGLWQYVQADAGTSAWVSAWVGLITGHLLAFAGILLALYYFVRRAV